MPDFNAMLNSVYEGVLWIAGTLVALFLLFSLLVSYLTLRARDSRGDEHDPQLGIKVGLHFFFSISMLLLLTGLSMLAVSFMDEEMDFLSDISRRGAALALSGLIFTVMHWLMLRVGTNDAAWPIVKRFFTGWRFAVQGLVFVASTTVVLYLLFERTPETPAGRFELWRLKLNFYGVVMIWGPAWLAHLGLLWWYGTRPALPRADVSWETKEGE